MTHNSESAIGFTMQINAYMQWTAFLDFLYTNYKLLWRNGNSKLSKCNFSFIYSSVDHSTWLPVKFLTLEWGEIRELTNIKSCKHVNTCKWIHECEKTQTHWDTNRETPVKLFSHSTSNHFYCNIHIMLYISVTWNKVYFILTKCICWCRETQRNNESPFSSGNTQWYLLFY